MKKNVLILTILYFCISEIYPQDLSKMTISFHNQDNIPTNVCKDGKLGIIVFYSAIKNLKFEAISPSTGGNAIVNDEYRSSDNCYILCVQPQKEANFGIKISANGFYSETYVIGSLSAKEKKIFMINSEDKTVEVTVFDKDNKPLDGYRVEIKGTGIVERGNNRGICKIELPSSNAATLVISHRLYEDTTEIIVRPGANERVRLYRLKPVIPTSKELTFVFKGIDKKNNSSVKLYLDKQLIGETNYNKGFQFKYMDTKLGAHELRVVWNNQEWKGIIDTAVQTDFTFEYKRKKTGFGYEYSFVRIK